jgi:hypothetical protein
MYIHELTATLDLVVDATLELLLVNGVSGNLIPSSINALTVLLTTTLLCYSIHICGRHHDYSQRAR